MTDARPWKFTEPQLPAPRSIEDKEKQYLNMNTPSLKSLTEQTSDGPFKKIKAKNCVFTDSKPFEQQQEIIIRNSECSNLRAFYYMLLHACFVRDCRTDQRSFHLLRSFKTFVYAESTMLELFGRQYTHRKYFTVLNSGPSMKKLLAEAFQGFQRSPVRDICLLIQSNPILDCVLMCVFRCLVVYHHNYLPELRAIDKSISTDIIVNSLRKQFAIRIEYTPFGELIFEEALVMKEEKEYTYLRNFTESLVESTNWKKTSESSSSHGVIGNILDMSKSLADISIIEHKPKNSESDTLVSPTMAETQQPRKLLKCLNVRRCDSIMAGHDSSSAESRVLELRRKTSRQSRQAYKVREAQSDKDDDSNDSGASCVIYKVEFGNQPHYKLPSPRSPRKKPSPNKILKIAQRDLNKKASIQNFDSKANNRSQKTHAPPSINIVKSPNIVEERMKAPSSTEQYLVSKLYTIPSVEDSCVEESMIAAVDDMDCQTMKSKLCEGTTSEAVLKILSPSVARVVLQKKQQSVKNLMEKFSKTSFVSSIRSSFEVGESSERLSNKLQRILQTTDQRRTSIGATVHPRESPNIASSDFVRKQRNVPYSTEKSSMVRMKKNVEFAPKYPKPEVPIVPRLVFGVSPLPQAEVELRTLTGISRIHSQGVQKSETDRFIYSGSSDNSFSPSASGRVTPREQPIQTAPRNFYN